jgi:hyaluronate lyase
VPHKNDLVAKKSWFCFDKETICLGAGITSTMNSPVNTVIEHKRIVDDEKYTQYLNGDALPKDSFSFEGEMDSFVMDGHAGFLLLDGNRTLVRRYKGESGQSFIEYLIRHGENPTNASYAYVILPFSTVSELEKYREKPEVEIISNTKEVQAVCKESLKITAYAFHEAAECDGIKVSAPCILTRKSVDAEVVICVSDPTHKLEELTVTVIGAYQECVAGSRAEVRYENEGAVITFDMKASYGEPRTFTLRK